MPNTYTPFADEMEQSEANQQIAEASFNNETYAKYSPFTNELEAINQTEGEWETDNVANEYYDTLHELHDNEFETAVDNLVAEMQEHFMSYESSNAFLNETHTEQLAVNYLQPIVNQVNELFEAYAYELESLPINQMNELELEASFDNISYRKETNFTPAQELFFKKIAAKVKAVAKKVLKVAGKLSPTKKILEQLKKLIGPLVERVLKFALKKFSPETRKIGIELANKLFKVKFNLQNDDAVSDDTSEGNDNADNSPDDSLVGAEGETPTVYPIQNIQAEFDHYLSQFIQTDNETTQNNLLAEYERAIESEQNNELENIENARATFIQELEQLKEGEDPTPALENFLPVVMKVAHKALQLAVKFYGRNKLVDLLAGLIAKWISKFLDPEKAQKLSVVMADRGLKLLKLETGENENDNKQVFEAIANTVEEVASKVGGFSEEVLTNETLFAHETYQAFESAAAAYFPDNAIRFEARESETENGYWQKHGRYSKFTKVFDITLNNSQLKAVETFTGVSLFGFAKDTLGLQTDKVINAKVHIYQAAAGATLSAIALNDKTTPGLGNANRATYNQFHPLTKQAAAVLLGQPSLGKDVRSIKNRNRNLIFVGERFYYLQIQGANAQPAITDNPTPTVTTAPVENGNINTVPIDVNPVQKSSQIRTVISGSFKQGVIFKAIIYLSENDSRIILEGLKKEDFGALYNYIKKMNPSMEKNFFGDKHKNGGIILKGIFETAGNLVKENLAKVVLHKIKAKISEFEKAVQDPKHGVTIIVQFAFPLTKHKNLKLRFKEAFETATLVITPGFKTKSNPVYIPVNSQATLPQTQNGLAIGKTFYAAISPIDISVFRVKKPSFN